MELWNIWVQKVWWYKYRLTQWKLPKTCTNITNNVQFISYTKVWNQQTKSYNYYNNVTEYQKTKLSHLQQYTAYQGKDHFRLLWMQHWICRFCVIKSSSQLTQHFSTCYILTLHTKSSNTNFRLIIISPIKGLFNKQSQIFHSQSVSLKQHYKQHASTVTAYILFIQH
jgi:hypothetical protein